MLDRSRISSDWLILEGSAQAGMSRIVTKSIQIRIRTLELRKERKLEEVVVLAWRECLAFASIFTGLDFTPNLTRLFQCLMSALRSAPCTPLEPSGKGRLVALRTKAEVGTTLQTVEAYIADVPRKSANSLLKCVKSSAVLNWADS